MWALFAVYAWLRVACLLTGSVVLLIALLFSLYLIGGWTLSAASRCWQGWRQRRWLLSLERSLPTSPGRPPSDPPSPSPGHRRSSGSFPL